MPGERVQEFWRERVYVLRREHPKLGPAKVRVELNKVRVAEDLSSPVPSERTVARIQADFDALDPSKKAAFGMARWPESCLYGALPWDAAPALLERLVYAATESRPLPTNRHVRWFWRITQAAPDMPVAHRVSAALQAEVWEMDSRTARFADLQWHLAYTPWRSGEHRQRYFDAVEAQRYGPSGPDVLRLDPFEEWTPRRPPVHFSNGTSSGQS